MKLFVILAEKRLDEASAWKHTADPTNFLGQLNKVRYFTSTSEIEIFTSEMY